MITHEELTKALHYCAETGVFTWKITKRGTSIGKAAGSISEGYIRICFNKKNYYAHRLALFYVNKIWPYNFIDHINCNKSDNRLLNLRIVNHAENLQNRKSSYKNSRSGIIGVFFNSKKRKYVAQITAFGKQHYLGLFNTQEEAHQAYLTAKRELHATCTI